MAKRRNNKNNSPVLVESNYDLAKVELSEADKALLAEISLNRRAILRLGQISLDHERRIANIEEALSDLVGEAEEPIDVEKVEDDSEDE